MFLKSSIFVFTACNAYICIYIYTQKKSSVLVRTMDVFLQDPVVDWVESCSKKRADVGEEDDGEGGASHTGQGSNAVSRQTKNSVMWEPKRRIRNAERKLNGCNPMEILIDDLCKNNWVTKWGSAEALRGIIKGQNGSHKKGGGPIRLRSAALQEETLSISDQVACLIDIATDPNILGRQWAGLATWV
jgi:DNA-dependent protein kinase catalytic subunit